MRLCHWDCHKRWDFPPHDVTFFLLAVPWGDVTFLMTNHKSEYSQDRCFLGPITSHMNQFSQTTFALRCQDAAVFIHDNQCRAAHKCPARKVLLGHALVEHPAMDHGDENQSACPAGFEGGISNK